MIVVDSNTWVDFFNGVQTPHVGRLDAALEGEEDLSVHHFQRFANDNGDVDFRRTQPFTTRLPNSPLSYDGPLIRIRWCVRVRVFLENGKDTVGEKIFRLGSTKHPGC